MKKLLFKMGIVQQRLLGGRKQYRLNPWNPLTYISYIVVWVVVLVAYGVVGVWDHFENRNPFKWH